MKLHVFLFTAQDKALEVGDLDAVPEPEEVRVAKDELSSLEKEKERTEKLKRSLEKELENAKDRAAKLEQSLPHKVTSEEQGEILSLMCKVHELEIENMEMQSSCLLRNFEIRRKHMVITKLMQVCFVFSSIDNRVDLYHSRPLLILFIIKKLPFVGDFFF